MSQIIPPGDPYIPLDETPIRVEIEWNADAPSDREIIAMRHLVPALAPRPIMEVKRILTSKASYTLGVFPRYSLWPTEERIKKMGLRYSLHVENR